LLADLPLKDGENVQFYVYSKTLSELVVLCR